MSTAPPAEPASTQVRRLVRPREGRVLAGVAAGIGAYLGVDPVVVRVVLAVLTVCGGAGVAGYLLGWLLIPAEGEPESILERALRRP